VQEIETDFGFEVTIIPSECYAQPGLAALLFSGPNESLDLAKVYLDVLHASRNDASSTADGHSESTVEVLTPTVHQTGVYVVGPELITLILRPLFRLVKSEISVLEFLQSCGLFANHVLFWREGTYCIWDPLPLFLLYTVVLPVHLVLCVFRREPWAMPIQ